MTVSTTTKIDELRAEAAAIAEQEGCSLLLLEQHGKTLRVVLDRLEGAVTLHDCTAVSRQLSAFLDVVDFGRDRYTLEVSSPGLDRPLLNTADYIRFQGQLARITFRLPDDEHKQTVVGRIDQLISEGDDAKSRVMLVVPPDGKKGVETRHDIPLTGILAARLEPEL